MVKAATGIIVGLVAVGLVTAHGDRRTAVSAQTPQKRLSWQEFSQDPARVKSLVAAFQAMRANDKALPSSADYRRSLQYWGAIHGYYGPKSPRGTVADAVANLKKNLPQFVSFFDGVTDLTPPDALAAEVWNTCQHSRRQNGKVIQAVNFFGWHRIYLYYFEQVLRALAKDDTLRLPYWDYTSTSQLAFPPEFGNGQTGPVNPPLFDPRRTQGLNDGLVVINPDLTDVDAALDKGDFLGEDGFEWAIEGEVHGNMHCAVGNTCPVPLMGSVGLSANDPIFWLHHANIDRLWDCWMKRHGVPSGDWTAQKYVFPDGDGNRKEREVSEFITPTEYVYDNVASCSRVPPPVTKLTTAAPQGPQGAPVTIASASKVSMAKPSTTVKLTMPSGGGMKSLSAAIAPQQADGTHVELVLSDITIEKAPASLLEVYLVAPSGARQRVGTINFFGQGDPGHDHAGLTRRFDVTRQLRELFKGAAPSNIGVVIQAASGVSAAPGRNAPAELTTPKWDGSVAIGSIELQLRPRAK